MNVSEAFKKGYTEETEKLGGTVSRAIYRKITGKEKTSIPELIAPEGMEKLKKKFKKGKKDPKDTGPPGKGSRAKMQQRLMAKRGK